MAEVEILGNPASTYVRAVRMACEEKGVAYDLKALPPQCPEVKAIHPFGKIPVMRHGDFELCESKAIATYLDLAFSGPACFRRPPAKPR
jgi:glutathione S-transferase